MVKLDSLAQESVTTLTILAGVKLAAMLGHFTVDQASHCMEFLNVDQTRVQEDVSTQQYGIS